MLHQRKLFPQDLFLWGYLKSKVFQAKPGSLQELTLFAQTSNIKKNAMNASKLIWMINLKICTKSVGNKMFSKIKYAI